MELGVLKMSILVSIPVIRFAAMMTQKMTRFDLRVAPNVCLKSMLTDRRRPRPSCKCDKVFDLKNMIYLRYLDVKPGRW